MIKRVFNNSHLGFDGVFVRYFFSVFVFVSANAIYLDVFSTVGYMYDVKLEASWFNFSVAAILLFPLTVASNFKSILYRHALDICVLGTFLPVAVVSCQTDSDFGFMFYPFLTVCVMSAAVFFFDNSPFFRRLSWQNNSGVSFLRIQWFIFFFCFAVVVLLIATNRAEINLNLVDTYFNAYKIRSEREIGGALSYFAGWFILVFYPFMLCRSEGLLKVAGPLLVLVGATIIYQAYALKSTFFNFFLIAAFSIGYSRTGLVKEFLPHIFFLFLIGITHLVGFDAHPLMDRFFYLIGLNSIFYFDFFSDHPLRFFEGTKLDLGLSNYGQEPGYVIDRVYYQGLGTNQSAGFLPTMFADLGLIGVVASSVVFGGIMAAIKSMQRGADSFAYLVTVALMFMMMNHSFNMLFLSNGLLVILVVAAIMKRRTAAGG